MAHPVTGIHVVVPARNEEESIEACLESIRLAATRVTTPVTVTVVLDDCTDCTADRIPVGVRSAVVRHRSAGAARRTGFWCSPRGQGVWYATTDADSLVPLQWFDGVLESASAGHAVRAGTILVADWTGREAGVRLLHDERYRVHADHGHIHGANLAIRADAYHAVGGFGGLAQHEDVELVRRLLAARFSVDWSSSTPVATSARRNNRVPGGFGGYLARLEEGLTT